MSKTKNKVLSETETKVLSKTETKVLSIDVGIKNLAFCLFKIDNSNKQNVSILSWNVVNLSQKESVKCCIHDCVSAVKFKKEIDKEEPLYYCLKHAKKQKQFKVPTADLKLVNIKKMKVAALALLAQKYDIKIPLKETKQGVVSLFQQYIETYCLESVEQVNASKLDLVTIGKNMMLQLDDILAEHLSTVDLVIIENQISPIANRMKTVQGMISQYFIMRNDHIQIEFISSANKLKDYAGAGTGANITIVPDSDDEPGEKEKEKEEKEGSKKEKLTYSDRKKMGIQYCLELLELAPGLNISYIPYFSNHKKKDDLADSFLQGVWYIKYKMK